MKIIEGEPYSLEWTSGRRGVPSTSNFKRIMTPKERKYAAGTQSYIYELIAERYDPNYGLTEGYVSAAMRNGSLMEPEACRFYEFERGCKLRQVCGCVSDDGRWWYTPDALCDPDGLVECKSPMPATHVAWLDAGIVPAEHLAQCHGALIVTGRKWIDFLSYCPGFSPLLVRVEPDDYTEALRNALEQFWTDYQSCLERLMSQAA